MAESIAVVGSGIAGLGVAYGLSLDSRYRVSLLEFSEVFGGHSHTVDVTLEGQTHPVDIGFLVHNDRTYPQLIKLLRHLGIERADSEMSFNLTTPSQSVS